MGIKEKIQQLYSCVNEKSPLVHHITNYVTVNDCANIVLALGGSAVMADAAEEVEDMVSIASALVLNIGTLNSVKIESMLAAGKKANQLGIPVILDPVGVGATPYRKEMALKLISKIKFAVIRGNLAEIKTLCGMQALSKGVDSEDTDNGLEAAKQLSAMLNTVVVISGKIDYISDGDKVITIHNGHEMLKKVTGTGCMSASLIGTYCGVTDDYFTAAAAGTLTMGIAGQIAYNRLSDNDGTSSYKTYIIDAISNFSPKHISEWGDIRES